MRRALGGASPINFPSSGFEVISSSQKLEEEIFEDFKTGRYYPVNIGEVFTSRYQVVSKLGFGSTSTVWLARDLRFDTIDIAWDAKMLTCVGPVSMSRSKSSRVTVPKMRNLPCTNIYGPVPPHIPVSGMSGAH